MPNIDQLTYAIKSEDSGGVANALERISTAITKLKSAQSGRWSNLTTISDNITRLGEAVNGFPDDKLKRISASIKSMSGAKVSVASVAKQTEKAVSAAQKVADMTIIPASTVGVDTLDGSKSDIPKADAEASAKKSGIKASVVLKKQLSSVNGFMKRFKGMVQRRIIMAIISGVVNSVKEGLDNLYNYSQEHGTRYAKVMDAMSVSMTYFKNSIAAAIAPIIEQVVPYISMMLDKIANFNNEVARFIAYVKGEDTYTKAIKGTTTIANNVGSAASSAKELRNTLLGFDEINRLDAENRTSGGGGYGVATSGNDMFAQGATGLGSFESDTGSFGALGKAIRDTVTWWNDNNGPVGWFNTKVAELLHIPSKDIQKWQELYDKLREGKITVKEFAASMREYNGQQEWSQKLSKKLAGGIGTVGLVLESGKKLFKTAGENAKEYAKSLIDTDNGAESSNFSLGKLVSTIGKAALNTNVLGQSVLGVTGVIGKQKDSFDATLPSVKSTTEAVKSLGDWLSKIKNNPQIDATENSFRGLGSTLNDKLHLDNVKTTFASFFKGTTDSMEPAKSEADKTSASFGNLFSKVLANTSSRFANSGIGTFLTEFATNAKNNFKPSVDSLKESINQLFNKTSETPASAGVASAAIKTVLDSVKNQFTPNVNTARTAYVGLTGDLAKAISTQPIAAFCSTTNTNLNTLVSKFGEAKSAANNFKSTVETINTSGPKITVGTTWAAKSATITTYASGGTPSTGSLFIAGEAGAELVSRSAGGGTSVSNMDQLSASVSAGNAGVINAIYEMADIVSTAIKNNSTTISTGDIVSSLSRMSRRDGKAVAIA